jgi:hypothetical protein
MCVSHRQEAGLLLRHQQSHNEELVFPASCHAYLQVKSCFLPYPDLRSSSEPSGHRIRLETSTPVNMHTLSLLRFLWFDMRSRWQPKRFWAPGLSSMRKTRSKTSSPGSAATDEESFLTSRYMASSNLLCSHAPTSHLHVCSTIGFKMRCQGAPDFGGDLGA